MSEQSDLDWMELANRKAKGRRPAFFEQPEDDRIYSVLLALVAEVSVMRQRLDTVERLLDDKGVVSRADIENYSPDVIAATERGELIREYILRVMRGPMQAVQALAEDEPPVEHIVEELLNS